VVVFVTAFIPGGGAAVDAPETKAVAEAVGTAVAMTTGISSFSIRGGADGSSLVTVILDLP
jgi:hypothetical protein